MESFFRLSRKDYRLETINGYVDHIIFRNEENGYTVLILVDEGEDITCVGTFTDVSEGENIECEGEFTTHPTYGKQFKTKSYQHKEPEDETAIERYLGSGAIKGLGKALAARIVKKFKKDTFRIIEEEPERLSSVKGISEQKAMDIANQINEKKDLRRAMIYLQQYGISTVMAVKIYKEYKQDVFKILKENPYKLAEDIGGIGFRTADTIAAKIGIKPDSDFRIQSGVLYTLQQASAEGHTYLPYDELIEESIKVLGVTEDQIDINIKNLAIDKKVVITEKNSDKQVFYAPYFYMESNSSKMLKNLNDYFEIADSEVENCIKKIEKKTGMELDDAQRDAVKAAAHNGVLIITGGPGTGKTTTINTIIKYFEMEGLDIFLAAPTGRAAKRMSETTGFEAKTIHRLLELNGGAEGTTAFEKNADNPLETDVIIIDEMSMVDINLMNALLKAIIPGQTRLILVGDASQLPSVGPGSVLKDLIESKCFKTVALTKIFRQASTSDIIVNAHKINKGEMVLLDNKGKDFFFLKRYEADKIINVTLQLIIQKLPKYVDATTYDIQVLTPMRKGLLGVERLNGILQNYINPPSEKKKEKEHNGKIFREGDKIMQMKNNYQIDWEVKTKYGLAIDKGTGVFNGDVGIIEKINDYTETITINFDDNKKVEYPFKLLDDLDLAYAITIHKSQGSEYPAVVMPLLSGPTMLMNRNLLYTAVTRAKKCVTIVGNDKTFDMMVKNVSQQKRYSGLKDRLMEDNYGN